MSSLVERFTQKGLIRPPNWLADNVIFETIMGSQAYGVSVAGSDFDTLGICVPPKDIVFPHLAGRIEGFGRQHQKFVCYQKHHIQVEEKSYDLNVYNIVHYFHLCMENNPNMLTSLFTPQDCILHTTQVGTMIREKRHIFLHKGCWPRFKGYAYSQLHKIQTTSPEPNSKREAVVKEFGWDVKFGYHVVRLLLEVEQILTERDLDPRRNREQLKAIRRGEMTMDGLIQWFADKERALERIYEESKLPWGPDEAAIKQLLLDCLETHYGTIEGCIQTPGGASRALLDIQDILDNYRRGIDDSKINNI